MRTPFAVGDRITLKKQHPCGGREWDVYRIGADIGLKCTRCDRRMMLTRRDAERRTVGRVAAAPAGGMPEPSESPDEQPGMPGSE